MNEDDRPDLLDLFAGIGVAVGAIAAIVAVRLALGWIEEPLEGEDGPSGVLISAVWTFLVAGLACARWLLLRVDPDAEALPAAIVGIGIAILVYPFFAFGFESAAIGLAANLLVAGALVFTGLRAARFSGLAAAFLFVPVLWFGYASYRTLQLMT